MTCNSHKTILAAFERQDCKYLQSTADEMTEAIDFERNLPEERMAGLPRNFGADIKTDPEIFQTQRHQIL